MIKTYIWTPRSTFYDARELSYTLKWLWTLLLALLVVLGTSGSSETCYNQLSMVKNLYLDTKINLLWCHRAELHNFPNIRVSGTFPGLPSHFWRSLEIKKVAPNLVSCRSRCIEAISIRKSCLQNNFLPPPYNSLCYVGYPAKVNVEFRTQIMRKRFLAEGGGYFEDRGTIL